MCVGGGGVCVCVCVWWLGVPLSFHESLSFFPDFPPPFENLPNVMHIGTISQTLLYSAQKSKKPCWFTKLHKIIMNRMS